MIGIFDSGIGGLTVVKKIKLNLPRQPFIYFGDIARFPWGNKSKKIVCQYSAEICNFLISRGATKIIVACNTASSLAGDFLKNKYNKIKFYNVIDPIIDEVEKEVHYKKNIRVGIIGTRATIASKVYENRIRNIKPNISIITKACPLLAPLVEENWTNNKITEKIVREYLKDLKKSNINILVLGCTHYPLLKKTIAKYLGKKTKIISSADAVAKIVKKEATEYFSFGLNKKKEIYYFSDWTGAYKNTMENILNEKVSPKKIKIINLIKNHNERI